MTNKRWMILLLVLVLLAGCTQTPEEEVNDQTDVLTTVEKGDYATIDPFVVSPTRTNHGLYLGKLDLINIDKRLLANSKAHFSPSDYSLAEGTIIDNTSYLSLIRSYDADNIYGLNPEKSETAVYLDEEKTVSMVNPVLVEDIIEKNFYKNSDLKNLAGISIAVVMRSEQTLDASTGLTGVFDDSILYQYGQQIANKLSNYLRSEKSDVVGDLPIYIAIYATSSGNSYLPGHFLGGAYYESRASATFTDINESWLMFTSSEASSLQPNIASQFDYVKLQVQKFITNESPGFVGKALVKDNSVIEMYIDVTCGFKSYTEVNALVQKINALLSNFGDYDYSINIEIKNYSDTLVTMKSENYQATTQVIWVD